MRRIALGAALALALIGCKPAGMDSGTYLACDTFAHDWRASMPPASSAPLAAKVGRYALHSKIRAVRTAAGALGQAADGPRSRWQLASDTFASECEKAGYRP